MQKKKILFIEDDAFLAKIYIKALDEAGYETNLCSNAEEGIKMLEREQPDLVLLDILLPRTDGFEFLERIKASPDSQNIPVLALTNMSNKEDVDRANQLGVSGYLIKAHTLPKDAVSKIQTIVG